MTRQEVYDYIVAQLAVPVTLIEKFLNSFSKVLDFITESTVSDIIPDWTITLTFNTDGTGDGKYCLHPDTNGKKRIFQTKTNGNIGNEPPTDPAITENTFWLEVSQASGSSIKEWSAGIYGTGLIIVFHNHSVDGAGLYKLVDPVRPFESTNIETEITAGDWELVSVSKAYLDAQILANINGIAWKGSVKARTTAALPANTVGGGNTTTANVNGAFPAQDGIAIALNDDILVMNEASQPTNGIYTLTQVGDAGTPWILTRRGDADTSDELQNAVVSVDQGTVHADTTWRQTTDGVILGTSNVVWGAFNPTVADASETVKGVVELATTAEATTGTDTTRAVTPAGLKAHVDAKAGINDTDIKYFEQFDWIFTYSGPVSTGQELPFGWLCYFSGTVAGFNTSSIGVNTIENVFGAIEVNCGNTAAGWALIGKSFNEIKVGSAIKLRFRLALSALSDATDTYSVYFGFGNIATGTEPANGIYFRYTHSVNGGNWEAVTANGGARTAVNTAVLANLLFSVFEIEVNEGGTSVTFKINNVPVATITTNIPNGFFGFDFIIAKSVGTAERKFIMDWYDFLLTRATPR